MQMAQLIESGQVERNNFIDDILHRGVINVAELVAVVFDALERIFKEFNDVGVFLCPLQGDGTDQPVSALIGFRELIREVDDAVIEGI